MITKLAVFDFDATLMDTPMPDEGKIIWKEKTGEEYPHVGWWGRKESLDTTVFDINPFPSVENALKDAYNDPDTHTVILTSRLEKLRPEVEKILNQHNIDVDEILLKKTNQEKNERVEEILSRFDSIDTVNLYDDREKEFNAYRKLKEKFSDKTINIYKADQGKISIIEGKNTNVSYIKKIINEEIQYFKINK